jgi:hypothetical protein
MKAFIAGVICAAVIGYVASSIVSTMQQMADVAFSTEGARVGDPGHHLVVN